MNNQYGNKIKEERVSQQLTQYELAEMTGKEQSYISGVETGNIKISTSIFMEIMAAMGIRVSVNVENQEISSNDKLL